MDRTEFLRALRETPREGWRAGHGLAIRREVGLVRDCPITAVCHATTGVDHTPVSWRHAVIRIGLPHREALKIVRAADNEPRASRALRAALLDAVGLTGRAGR